MKIKNLPLLTLSVAMMLFVSCKEDKNKTNPAEANAAADVSAEATKFMIDKDASYIKWEGNKPTGSHHGTVKLESGVVKTMGDSISGSFLINMNSIDVEDLKGEDKEKLENHLKGTVKDKETDFFNVTKYPTAAFEITGVLDKDGKKIISGNLTLKDAKKNIEFPATYEMDGDMMTLKSEPFTIDRTQWNVNYGSKSVFDDLKDNFISDDITLTIDIVAKKIS